MEFLPLEITIHLIFLVVAVFIPDFYIIPLRNKLMSQVESISVNLKKENKKLFFITQGVGWIERLLYFIFLVAFSPQFTIFLGIWLALKTVFKYQGWQDKTDYHGAKAKFYVFLIGNGLSIASVMICFFLVEIITSLI